MGLTSPVELLNEISLYQICPKGSAFQKQKEMLKIEKIFKQNHACFKIIFIKSCTKISQTVQLCWTKWLPGSEVIKLFSCSTQLSTKFQLLIKTKTPTNEVSCFISLRCCIYHANKCLNANNCWHSGYISCSAESSMQKWAKWREKYLLIPSASERCWPKFKINPQTLHSTFLHHTWRGSICNEIVHKSVRILCKQKI